LHSSHTSTPRWHFLHPTTRHFLHTPCSLSAMFSLGSSCPHCSFATHFQWQGCAWSSAVYRQLSGQRKSPGAKTGTPHGSTDSLPEAHAPEEVPREVGRSLLVLVFALIFPGNPPPKVREARTRSTLTARLERGGRVVFTKQTFEEHPLEAWTSEKQRCKTRPWNRVIRHLELNFKRSLSMRACSGAHGPCFDITRATP